MDYTLEIRKLGENQFYHIHNNNENSKFAISAFNVSVDGDTFCIVQKDGSKRFRYKIANVTIKDITTDGVGHIYTDPQSFYQKLIDIRYIIFDTATTSGGTGGVTGLTANEINAITNSVNPSAENHFVTLNDLAGLGGVATPQDLQGVLDNGNTANGSVNLSDGTKMLSINQNGIEYDQVSAGKSVILPFNNRTQSGTAVFEFPDKPEGTYTLATLDDLISGGTSSGGFSNKGIIIPYYLNPNPTDTSALIALLHAHPTVPVLVVVNPSNGAGTAIDSSYTNLITAVQGAGAKVIGYTYTKWGDTTGAIYGEARPISLVESEIAKWYSFYPTIDGIFLDEMATDETKISLYQAYTSYVHNNFGAGQIVIGNAGADESAAWFTANAVDVIVIHESNTYPTSLSTYDSYALPPDRAVLVHTQSWDLAQFNSIMPHVKWIYITGDGTDGNPWDSLSSYMSDMLIALEGSGSSSGGTTGTTPTLQQVVAAGNSATGEPIFLSPADNSATTTLAGNYIEIQNGDGSKSLLMFNDEFLFQDATTGNSVNVVFLPLTDSHVIAFPDKSGTIALLSDIASSATPNLQEVLVAGNITTDQSILLYNGANTLLTWLNAGTVGIQSIDGSYGIEMHRDSINRYDSSGNTLTIGFDTLTVNQTITFPNKSGTIALLSDIASGGGTDTNAIHKTGDETITGGIKTVTVSATTKFVFNNATAADALTVANSSTGRGIYASNSNLSGIGIYSDNTGNGKGVYVNNASNGTGLYINQGGQGLAIYVNNPNLAVAARIDNVTGTGLQIQNTTTGTALELNGASGGVRKLISAKDNGTERASITSDGTITATEFKVSALNTAPASSTAAGTLGEIRITAGFIYVCTATNTWVRAALTTF